MAACTTTYTTTYFEAGRSFAARAAERNAELMAQQAQRRRRVRTPEFHFVKHFDNSRLVKAADPVRVREMRVFAAAVAVLFSLIMVYGLQHFYAIESSYRVESEKQTLDQLREQNRQLRLSQAELDEPGRIDGLAHQLGLAAPEPGQVVHPDAHIDSGAPVLAQISKTASSF
jgi:cell division protein FtsL